MTRGVDARAAAFTSVIPGADLSRLASEQGAELLLVDAPDRLLEDTRLLALLEDAPCDVAVLVDRRAGGEPWSSPLLGQSMTGRRSSSARGSRWVPASRCGLRVRRPGQAEATRAAYSQARRSLFSAPSESTPSRCSSSPRRRRSSRPRATRHSWSSGSRTGGDARASVTLAPRSPRHLTIRPFSSAAACDPVVSVPARARPASPGRSGREASHLAQGGGVAFRHGWLPGPGGGDLERSPPKLCSTPGTTWTSWSARRPPSPTTIRLR